MSNEHTKTESDENDSPHLETAAAEGDAYQRSLRHLIDDLAETGGTERKGDYIVAFAQDGAEGMYRMRNGELEWVEPTEDNCHIEISVCDAADKRFIPHLAIRITLIAEDGVEIGPVDVPFVWHPGMYHYGRNLAVPEDGLYTLRVNVDPPTFSRHDEKKGDRYGEPIEVTFEDVLITTGKH